MRQLLVLGWIFLGIAILETVGKIIFGGFPQIPYLTANVVGPFDYALLYAILLHGARWLLKTMFAVEDVDLEDEKPQKPSSPRHEETRQAAPRWKHDC